MARIGVFVCWCGSNIAETVDSPAVAAYARTLPSVVVARDYRYTCSEPGQRMITDAIREYGLTGVLVASCSPRMHEATFRKTAATVGLNPYMLEMANIREHCSWVHTDREKATAKAKDLVRLMVEKLRRNRPLAPIVVPVTQRVMVVGAGIAGIQVALDVAAAGYEVVLVERKPSIGGHMAQLDETFPTLDCSQCILTPRMVDIMQSDKIKLYTYAEVESVDGYIGNFNVKVRKKARSVDVDKCTGCGDCFNNCMSRNKISVPERVSVAESMDQEMKNTLDVILEPATGEHGMLISVLQDIQKKYNYLPPDALRYTSERLNVPLSRTYGLARFYNSFSLTPRGKNLVRVCMGTACHVKGAGLILQALERLLDVKAGETTEDGDFTLEPVRCLGCCGLAPVMTINDDLYGAVTQAKLPKILERYRKQAPAAVTPGGTDQTAPSDVMAGETVDA
ncbi:MAG: FAD-dependent oxidoreductase [Kiritimatiellaeota bacterium]|nr:FAD-dependent oxidoreductase [Kiritimatiellota bacterium]